jgi:ubiquinone/menaquinone biosynthesis C-methylase UbiE
LKTEQVAGHAIVVPPEVFDVARDTLGAFFEPLARIDRTTLATDFLDQTKAVKRAEVLERYARLRGRKVLEIGSGFGTNLAAWSKLFDIDGYGVEPSSVGFEGGYAMSKRLLEANGIDPQRIVDAAGEHLPFEDETFDIVYSTNVLEHTSDPARVLMEGVRVLRAGGLLHMEMPNHLSYFEGHYLLPQPPLISRKILPAWVRLFGRDPAFAKTIQTQINPNWLRRELERIASHYTIEVVSLGEDVFLDRLSQPFTFETKGAGSRLGRPVRDLQRVNYRNWIGKLIVLMRGHFPLYVTVRRV